MELDKELLEILACPQCKTSVRLEGERLVCESCGRRYPIRDGIPIMLIEEAEVPGEGGGSGKEAPGPGEGSPPAGEGAPGAKG